MMNRALLGVAGFLALAASLPAQAADQLVLEGATLDQVSLDSPWASLDNRDRFFFSSAFGSIRRSEQFLPSFDPSEPFDMAYLPSSDRNDALDRIIDWDARKKIRFGGEAGVFYGKSTGKYGREDFLRYISGTIGNEMFSITVGYSHQETTFDGPRRRR